MIVILDTITECGGKRDPHPGLEVLEVLDLPFQLDGHDLFVQAWSY
jgi:hypothetical protein